MKKYFITIALGLFILGCQQEKENQKMDKGFRVSEKEVTIYTTAENTDQRLAMTGTKSFEPAKQPEESEIMIFEYSFF